MPSRLSNKLRAPLRAAGFLGFTAAALSTLSLHERLVPPARVDTLTDCYVRRWARGLLAIFGIRVVVHTDLPPCSGAARLIVSNHRSPVDILVLVSLFGGSFLSRGDVAKWPVIGRAARKAGTIFVDRTSSTSGVTAVREMRQRLKDGDTLIVFPEGTTFAGDEVQLFKPGAFLASHHLPCEVVPVGLAYDPGAEWTEESFVDHLQRVASAKTLRVDVCVGQASSPDARTQDSARRYRSEVAELVAQARAARGPD